MSDCFATRLSDGDDVGRDIFVSKARLEVEVVNDVEELFLQLALNGWGQARKDTHG